MADEFVVTEYGRIASHFHSEKLEYLCPGKSGVQTGPFGSQLHKEDYVDDGTPIITVEHLLENRISHFDTPCVSDSDRERLIKYSLSEGDIVFSRVGSVDRRSLVRSAEDGWLFSGRCLRVRVEKSMIDPAYLSYFFGHEGFRNHIRSIAVGATMPSINTKILSDVKIYYPHIEEQKSIAHILGTLDDKIELNRQMNTTLESMAQALFKSWFVDFDPVIDNALKAGNPIPEPLQAKSERRKALGDQRRPLPEHIQNKFPSSFVFSEEMGWVPEGWEITNLESITTELRRGISPKYTEQDGVCVINQKCIRDHVVNFSLARRHDETKKKISGRELKVGDVLVNSTGVGTLGRMAQVLGLEESTVADSHVTVVRSNSDVCKPYTFARMMLQLEPIIEAMGEGSTGQTELSRTNLQAISALIPSMKSQEFTEKMFFDSAEKIAENSKDSESLAKLRDTLLPKLISGQLRIPDAEKQLADAI